MKKLIVLIGVISSVCASALATSQDKLHDSMNDLLAQVSPVTTQSELSKARDMIYQCFLNNKPCPIDGYWMPSRSARLHVTEVFRPNTQQVARARALESRYQNLMYAGRSVSRDVVLDKMNDLLGEFAGPTKREDTLREAQGMIVRCFINSTCESFVDYGFLSSRKFTPSLSQKNRATALLKIYNLL